MMEFCREKSRLDGASDSVDALADRDCEAWRMLAARIEERRLSLRFSSWWASRMASSMEPVLDSCSALSSSWAMLLEPLE